MHQSRVNHCPCEFPVPYYWYGTNRKSSGHAPQWIESLLDRNTVTQEANGVDDEVIEEAEYRLKSDSESDTTDPKDIDGSDVMISFFIYTTFIIQV